LILKYGLGVAIVSVVLGFVHAGYRAHQEAGGQRLQQGPITQQAGPCGLNIVGDKNEATVDCVDKAGKTK
jgi:hypothetical protein